MQNHSAPTGNRLVDAGGSLFNSKNCFTFRPLSTTTCKRDLRGVQDEHQHQEQEGFAGNRHGTILIVLYDSIYSLFASLSGSCGCGR